jgi:predicted PolB exonuclease-like 3'-5' exonuclease
MVWNEYLLSKILFIDIETVGQKAHYDDLSDVEKKLWDKKASVIQKDENPDVVYSKSGIFAEFGKIVCISVGFLSFRSTKPEIRLKSFYGEDESLIIQSFFQLIKNHYNTNDCNLCAHNGKEFDFPYVCRRAIILGIEIPEILQIQDKKPWEVRLLDTLTLWKFGDYKSYTSLELLAYVLSIPTPKDDIDGSMVGEIYWTTKDLPRIVTYCQKDVITLIKIFLKISGQYSFEEKDFSVVESNE